MGDVISTYRLSGLHCGSCKKISEMRVKKIEGVVEATTNLETGELIMKGNRVISKHEVIQALEGTEYQVNEGSI